MKSDRGLSLYVLLEEKDNSTLGMFAIRRAFGSRHFVPLLSLLCCLWTIPHFNNIPARSPQFFNQHEHTNQRVLEKGRPGTSQEMQRQAAATETANLSPFYRKAHFRRRSHCNVCRGAKANQNSPSNHEYATAAIGGEGVSHEMH